MAISTNNYRYILTDKNGRDFEINPEELDLVKEIKKYFELIGFNYKKNRVDSNIDLTLDDAVHVFNSLQDGNEELKNAIIEIYNRYYIPLNPDNFKSVKLITRKTTNIFGLPIYKKVGNENKGSLIVPIIYSEDIAEIDSENYYIAAEEISVPNLIEPNILMFTFKIKTPDEIKNNSNIEKSMIPFYVEEYALIKKYCLSILKNIEIAEKQKGNVVQIIQDYYEATKNKHIDKYLSIYTASVYDIMNWTTRISKGNIENRKLFEYYVPTGHLFYRMIMDLLVFYKKVYLMNDQKVSIFDALKDPKMYERYLMYSEEEFIRITNEERLNKEMEEIYEDVKDDLEKIKKEEKMEKDVAQTERDFQDEINEYNENETVQRPSYVPYDEFEGLPFEKPSCEIEEDYTPEHYYSYEDVMYNKEIRDAIYPDKDSETIYSDLDERKEGNR